MATIGREVAAVCRPSWCQDFLREAFGPNPGSRSQDVAHGVHGAMGRCRLSGSHVRLRPGLSRTGPGVGRLQWRTRPKER